MPGGVLGLALAAALALAAVLGLALATALGLVAVLGVAVPDGVALGVLVQPAASASAAIAMAVAVCLLMGPLLSSGVPSSYDGRARCPSDARHRREVYPFRVG